MAKKTQLGAEKRKAAADLVAGIDEEKPVRINVAVPRDLHRAFKVKAAQENRSHQDILLDAIRRYVEQ